MAGAWDRGLTPEGSPISTASPLFWVASLIQVSSLAPVNAQVCDPGLDSLGRAGDMREGACCSRRTSRRQVISSNMATHTGKERGQGAGYPQEQVISRVDSQGAWWEAFLEYIMGEKNDSWTIISLINIQYGNHSTPILLKAKHYLEIFPTMIPWGAKDMTITFEGSKLQTGSNCPIFPVVGLLLVQTEGA